MFKEISWTPALFLDEKSKTQGDSIIYLRTRELEQVGIKFTSGFRSLENLPKTDLRSLLTFSNFLYFSTTCLIQFNIFKLAFKALYNTVPSSFLQATRTQTNSPVAISYISPTLQHFDTFIHSVLFSRCTYLFLTYPIHICFPHATWNFTFCEKIYWYSQLEVI